MSSLPDSKANADSKVVIAELVRIARPLMVEAHWIPDTCLPASRVGIKVLAHFGIKAQALVVKIRAMNGIGAHHIERCELLRLNAAPPVRAWKVDIGYQPVLGKWGRHLVAVTSDDLIDLSLDQVNRPDKNLVAVPTWQIVSKDFLAGKVPATFTFEGGTKVRYDALAGDTTYLTQAAWLDERPQDVIVEQTIERMKALEQSSPS